MVLADEINRATPNTQSALLEAMSERRVSVERKRFTLPEPFTVLATQNPLEYQGTFPLPESQLDRFLMSLSLGYPPRADEKDLLLSGGVENILDGLQPVLSGEDLLDIQERVARVRVADKLADYILSLAEATRHGGDFLLGVSTRGAQVPVPGDPGPCPVRGEGLRHPGRRPAPGPSGPGPPYRPKRGTTDLDQARKAIERVVAGIPVPL